MAAALAALACLHPCSVRAEGSKEYLVKAAFIYHFVKFVEWPDAHAVAKKSFIDICTYGESGMDDTHSVFKTASTEKLRLSLMNEPELKRLAQHCHIVFITQSEALHLETILSTLRGLPVLTVSDIPDFARKGGMVGFVTNENKVRLEVNTRPAAEAHLRIDAQLLEIALKVYDR